MMEAVVRKPIAFDFKTLFVALAAGLAVGIGVVGDPMVPLMVITLAAAAYLVSMRLIYGVAGLAFVLPFQQMFTVEMMGYTLKPSHLMALVIVAAILFSSVKKDSIRIFVTPMDLPYALFILCALVSIGRSVNLSRSIVILVWIAISFSIYFIVSRVLNRDEELAKVLRAFIAAAVGASIFGVYQFAASYMGLPTWLRDVYIGSSLYLTRIHSTFLEPLHFANYIVVSLPLTLAWVLYGQRRGRTKYWFGMAVMAVALLMTISRGGYLSLAIAMGVFWLLGPHKRTRLSFRPLAAIAVLAAVVIVIVLILAPSGMIKETVVGGAAIRAGSSLTRVMLIQDAIRMFDDSPYTGIGIGNFGPYYNMKTYRSTTDVSDFRQVNNVPFEVLAETGIIGMTFFILTGLAYVWMLWVAITRAKSRIAYGMAVGAAAASAGAAAQFMAYSPMYGEWIWFLVGITGALWKMAISSGGMSCQLNLVD